MNSSVLLLFVWLAFFSTSTHADNVMPWHTSIGSDQQDFSYKELKDDGGLINREDGFLWGLTGTLYKEISDWNLSLSGAVRRNHVAYYGQTTGGSGIEWVNSTTYQEFFSLSLVGGRTLLRDQHSQVEVYMGLGYERWERDIQDSMFADGVTPVSGLYEIYTWQPISVGLRMYSHALGWGGDVKGIYVYSPDMLYVEKSVRFHMAERSGFRFSLYKGVSVMDRTIMIEPYVEQWGFGKSPAKTVPSGGSFLEPESTTQNVGIMLKFIFP